MADAPGLFSVLVRDGVLPRAEVEGLARGLPEESFVCTGAREGEAFDSTRWRLAYDAALAAYAAARLDPSDSVQALVPRIRDAARDGLFAYHVHRRIAGPTAEPAAAVVRAAIESGRLATPELMLAARFVIACGDVARIAGARWCSVLGDGFALPLPQEGGTSSMFVVSAGSRALVALSFDEEPRWVQLVAQLRGRPLDLRDGAWTLVVPDRSPPAEFQPAAAVASLVAFVSVGLDAHLALHPEDGARFPVLDDAALARIFG